MSISLGFIYRLAYVWLSTQSGKFSGIIILKRYAPKMWARQLATSTPYDTCNAKFSKGAVHKRRHQFFEIFDPPTSFVITFTKGRFIL